MIAVAGHRLRILPLIAALLVAAGAGLVGWLASQPPLPDPMPYEIALPDAPATAQRPAEVEAEASETVAELVTAAPLPAPDPEAVALGTLPLTAPATAPRGQVGTRATTMQPTPHPALIEQGRHGMLPVVAPDGRQS